MPAAALRFTPPGEKPTRQSPGVWFLDGRRRSAASTCTPGISDGELTAIDPGALDAGRSASLVELTPEGRKAYGLAH